MILMLKPVSESVLSTGCIEYVRPASQVESVQVAWREAAASQERRGELQEFYNYTRRLREGPSDSGAAARGYIAAMIEGKSYI